MQRYSRHILLPQVGGKGQERLLASSVALAFGPDGEGPASVAATYLAAAGVGRIGWCPLAGGEHKALEEGSLAGLIRLYDSGGPSASIAALNPDARLEVSGASVEPADGFDLLIISGDDPALEDMAARFEAAGRQVIRASRCGWAGAVASEPGVMKINAFSPEEAEGPLPAAPAEGVLGSMLASAALCSLLKEEKPVGSTAQARFDLSRGLFEGAMR